MHRTLQRALTLTEPARVCLAGLGHPTSRLLIAGTSHGVTDHPTRIFVTDGYTRGGSVRRLRRMLDVLLRHREQAAVRH